MIPLHTHFCYIDPSAVTFIIQAAAGAVIALGAVLTIFRHKIFKRFRKQSDAGETAQEIIFKETAHTDDAGKPDETQQAENSGTDNNPSAR